MFDGTNSMSHCGTQNRLQYSGWNVFNSADVSELKNTRVELTLRLLRMCLSLSFATKKILSHQNRAISCVWESENEKEKERVIEKEAKRLFFAKKQHNDWNSWIGLLTSNLVLKIAHSWWYSFSGPTMLELDIYASWHNLTLFEKHSAVSSSKE